MAAAPAQSETNLSGRFHRDFQHTLASLEEQIERLNITVEGERAEAVDQCLAGIDRLSHDVKDASAYLPAYDQRTYSQHIKSLSEKLQVVRNTFSPPKKFSFKNRKNASAVAKPEKHPDTARDSTMSSATDRNPRSTMIEDKDQAGAPPVAKEEEADGIQNGPGIRRPSFSHASKITVSNHSDLHLVLPASASRATSSGTLSNLDNSIIDLSPASNISPILALYLKNISHSLILCGQVAGAIHITSVTNSVLVMTTRQFRMHGSKNVDVYLHAASRPIIEDCDNIRFAPLPGIFAGDGPDGQKNMWDQIDDFKWLKAEPSPNFRVMSVEERKSLEMWKRVVEAGTSDGDRNSYDLDEALRAVGVRR